MSLIETESIVLKTYSLAEADKIVLLLTRDHGLVRGVAKGAKRLKSKFGSGLEPFTLVNAGYFQRENLELVSIQKTELVRSNFASASDPDFLNTFSYLADLVAAFLPPHDPNQTLYRMVKASIEAAGRREGAGLDAISVYFQLWLLKLSGYLPDWSRCERCRRPLALSEEVTVTGSLYLECHGCSGQRGRSMPEGVRGLADAILRRSPGDFLEGVPNAAAVAQLAETLRLLMSRSLGRELAAQPKANGRSSEVAR